MSRLTEREPHWLGEEFWVSAQEPDEEELDEVYMKLKHYEDLEEQGRLLKLPCLVGSRMYYIGLEGTIYNIQLSSIEMCLMYADGNGNFKNGYFASKEEAEAVLKEGTNNGL